VAGLTDICRLDMLLIFAGCCGAVVAADAVATDAGMIKGCRYPGIGGMAVVTRLSGLNMVGRLADSGITIMTAGTIAAHRLMFDPVYRAPTNTEMTVGAAVIGVHMVVGFN